MNKIKVRIFNILLISFIVVFTVLITYFPGLINIGRPGFEYCDKLFDKSNIIEIELTMSEDDLNDMMENALKEEYHKCDVVINGEKFPDVGVRTKGNTSLSHVYSSGSDRFSLRLSFDKYINDQTCFGLDDLAINNLVSDATFIKEYMTYDMFEYVGAKAPLCNMCTLKINGKNRGVYAAIEVENKSFLRRCFGSSYGELYKPEGMMEGGPPGMPPEGMMEGEPPGMPPEGMMEGGPPGMPPEGMMEGEPPGMPPEGMMEGGPPGMPPEGMMEGGPPGMPPEGMMGGGPPGMPHGDFESADNSFTLKYIDDNFDSYSGIFESARTNIDSNAKRRLITALKNINRGKNLDKYLFSEDQLKYIIVNAFVTNSDGYFGHMLHNYYLYEENGRLLMLPWDYNLAFGGFEKESASYLVNMPIDDPVNLRESAHDARPMIYKLLDDNMLNKKYHAMFDDFIKGYVESGRAEKTIDNVDMLIRDYVEKDPTKFYTYREYQRAIYVLKRFIEYRAESIRLQLDGKIGKTKAEQAASSKALIQTDFSDFSEMGMQNNRKAGDKPPINAKNQF